MNSPIGIYKRQLLFSTERIVYHYAVGDYYLYKRENEWVVRILKPNIPKILGKVDTNDITINV